jgi:hypothetical protein
VNFALCLKFRRFECDYGDFGHAIVMGTAFRTDSVTGLATPRLSTEWPPVSPSGLPHLVQSFLSESSSWLSSHKARELSRDSSTTFALLTSLSMTRKQLPIKSPDGQDDKPVAVRYSRNHSVMVSVPIPTETGYMRVGLFITIGSSATASAGGT